MHVRTAAALVAAGLCVAPFAASAGSASASAHPSHDVAAASVRLAPAPLIKGVVVDQFGDAVDGVKVQATDAKGKPAASALTYASRWISGPQHGFFFVEVGARGTYALTLSKPGYVTKKVTGVELTRRRLALGEITLQKEQTPTTTVATLAAKVVTTKQNGRVSVVVAPTAKSPTGEIEIRDGREVVGEGSLKATNKGALSIVLDRLDRGTHTLVASYLGSSSLKPSKSGAVTLVVRKAHR